jgi:hypothetical protein
MCEYLKDRKLERRKNLELEKRERTLKLLLTVK